MKLPKNIFARCVALFALWAGCLLAAEPPEPSEPDVIGSSFEVVMGFSRNWQALRELPDAELRSAYRALSLDARSMLALSIRNPPHRKMEERLNEQARAFVGAFYNLYVSKFVFFQKQLNAATDASERNEVKILAKARLKNLIQVVPVGSDIDCEACKFVANLAVARAAIDDDAAFIHILTNAQESLPDEFRKAVRAGLSIVKEEENHEEGIQKYRTLFEQVYRHATGGSN